MSYTKIWIHCVWSTKLRLPFLKTDLRNLLFEHIILNGKDKSIKIIQIGGWFDHVHILIKLHPSQNLSNIIHSIKGESSSWINKNNYSPGKFFWQEAYYAESISKNDINPVKKYIKNQENHHSIRTFLDEIKMMKKK